MADTRKVYLAADLGASNGRVMAGIYDGEKLAIEEVHRFENQPQERDGSFRWDFDVLLQSIKTGFKAAAAKFGKDIVSVGVDTWGVDYGLLDESGKLIDMPFAYRDPRTEKMEEEACKRVPRREIYETTGIQFMFFNTLFQILSEVVAGRQELKKASRLLFTPDLVNYMLSGVATNEYTISSTSQLLDVRKRDWATGMMAKMGIPTHLFGDITQPGTCLGPILPEIQGATGLQNVNVVAVGGHDTASAVAAVPAESDSYAYLSSGSWSLMGIESAEPVVSDSAYDFGFTNEGGVGGTIRLLKNITGLWILQECRRAWAEAGSEMDFGEIGKLAQESEPFRSFIDPDDPSFTTPGDMPARIRDYCVRTDQPVPETPGQFARTALESLAFRCRTVFSNLEKLTGRRIDVLHIVGGGIKDVMLSQLTANAINRTVIAGPVEASSAGNIIVQMMAAGALATREDGKELMKRSFEPINYEPTDRADFEKAYECFHALTGA